MLCIIPTPGGVLWQYNNNFGKKVHCQYIVLHEHTLYKYLLDNIIMPGDKLVHIHYTHYYYYYYTYYR